MVPERADGHYDGHEETMDTMIKQSKKLIVFFVSSCSPCVPCAPAATTQANGGVQFLLIFYPPVSYAS